MINAIEKNGDVQAAMDLHDGDHNATKIFTEKEIQERINDMASVKNEDSSRVKDKKDNETKKRDKNK